MKFKTLLTIALFFTSLSSSLVYAHCEIPCGIYGDEIRFQLLKEQITTVEKSMNEINKLSDAAKPNYNQIVRWVTNKDKHADDIREIVTQYFLAQRIKPVDGTDKQALETYQKKLETLHLIIVHAMKAKQTTDLKHVETLRQLVDKFYNLYFDQEMQQHLNEHKHN